MRNWAAGVTGEKSQNDGNMSQVEIVRVPIRSCIQKQLSGGATCLIFLTNQHSPISLLTNDVQAEEPDRVSTFSFQAFSDKLSTIQLS